MEYRLTSAITEYVTDIKDAYPEKSVTFLHSRDRVLPQYSQAMHEHGMSIYCNQLALLD